MVSSDPQLLPDPNAVGSTPESDEPVLSSRLSGVGANRRNEAETEADQTAEAAAESPDWRNSTAFPSNQANVSPDSFMYLASL